MKATRLAKIRALAEQHKGKGSKCVEMLLECVAEIEKLQSRREKPRGPSLSEVMAYGEEIVLKEGDPESFFDYHEARGWMLGPRGTVPMRDFKAAMRTWKRRVPAEIPADRGLGAQYGVG